MSAPPPRLLDATQWRKGGGVRETRSPSDGVIPLRRRTVDHRNVFSTALRRRLEQPSLQAVLHLYPPFPDERILRSMLTMYTTTCCGYCVRLKRGLKAAGIGFDEVNIEEDAAGAELVMDVNDGNMTVPTIVFSDGTTLTNPALDQVRARLAKAS
jgi:mycoredoxin